MLEVIESDFGRSLAQAESIESSRAEEHDAMAKQNKLTEVGEMLGEIMRNAGVNDGLNENDRSFYELGCD